MKIVAVSGFFDPLHNGHIEYFYKAKELGDCLVVIINTDRQAIIKKRNFFLPATTRLEIIKALKPVDKAILSIDKDRTVCETLRFLKPTIFAKGGDRFEQEIPEKKVCDELGIQIVDGLGLKVDSSSNIIEDFLKREYQSRFQ